MTQGLDAECIIFDHRDFRLDFILLVAVMAFVAGGLLKSAVASVETQTEKIMVDASTQTWKLGEGCTELYRAADPDVHAALAKWGMTKSTNSLWMPLPQ